MKIGEETGCILPTGLLLGREICVGRVHDSDRWTEAEDRIAELINRIQPNEESEKSRKAIADYIQSLIGKCFSCQVFIFGSVPLKTNLPDGDIDLTLISNDKNLKDTWTDKVYQVLKEEEKNENAEFRLKEVQQIVAGVKVIKCLVESIVVDISFNQIGGLGTLCFLEEMDRFINQDHLFKRSVILIKAWCYYESRILGAHHGLISTYALETLILYIFHVFDNSFTGPLEVLYHFLELFSNFDWDNFCVSIWGPAPINLLPEMAVLPPRKDDGELFHKKFFLKSCSMFYDILMDGQHKESRSFVLKYLNVIDPLCMHNNLGRSVCKGSFLRIRSAFEFGAKKLSGLLDFPKEKMISELTQFFMNTWERHAAGLPTNSSIPSFEKLLPSKSIQVGESYTCRYISYLKEQNDDISEYLGGEHLADVGLSFYGASSQILRIINQHSKDISSHKNQNHVQRTFEPAKSLRTNKNDENSSSDYRDNVEKGDHRFQDELCRFCSAKTSFLSGLINASEISFGESHIIVDKSDNHDDPPIGSEHDCTKKRFPLGVTSRETVNTINDSSFSRQSSSLQATVTTTILEESGNYVTPKIATKSEVQKKVDHRSDAGYTADTGLVLPSNSARRSIANSGVVPPALYPTGPPVPFLAMLQTCNFPSQGGCYGGVYGEFDREVLICDNAAFNGNANPGGICDHHIGRVSASAVGSKWSQTPALPNLPRGWRSQNIPFIRHSAYPYPIAVPMVVQYFQDTIPLGGLARSSLLQGSQFVPATDIWPETQIRTNRMLTFGDGVSNCHDAIRTYPTSFMDGSKELSPERRGFAPSVISNSQVHDDSEGDEHLSFTMKHARTI
ncbi:hypothetical protein KSP39_PZI021987 [Platanthera zijinensis]|uniref:Polymerase nucleotidyl transferase domain-containing protein n=1 Tax=Platanthera zijinensis TaxID=2320716 RepID=A0AAP0FVJ3_9ASPA